MDNLRIEYIKKNPEWIKRSTAAKITTLSTRQIDRYIASGRLYGVKLVNGRVLIAKQSLHVDFLNSPKPMFN